MSEAQEIKQAGKEAIKRACKLIKKWEGFRAKPYQCSAKVWTIGYGSTYDPDLCQPITQDTEQISKNTAAQWLEVVAQDIHFQLWKHLFPHHAMNDNQKAALISFAYNLGIPALKSSTLRKKIVKHEDFEGAAKEFEKWVYADGRKLQGLVNRREDEMALFCTPQDEDDEDEGDWREDIPKPGHDYKDPCPH